MYERIKKLRRKAERIRQLIAEMKQKVEKEEVVAKRQKVVEKREWYTSYHWFFTSGGRLVLGGRDARSNVRLVRRHLEKRDLFMHADVIGAPAVVIKDGQGATEKELEEAAIFAASFSSAWKRQQKVCDVYCVQPEQVHLAAKAGEYLPKGAFVITGRRKWFRKVPLRLAVGYADGIVVGPEEAIKKVCEKYILIEPAEGKKAEGVRKLADRLADLYGIEINVDRLMSRLPAGGLRMVHPLRKST